MLHLLITSYGAVLLFYSCIQSCAYFHHRQHGSMEGQEAQQPAHPSAGYNVQQQQANTTLFVKQHYSIAILPQTKFGIAYLYFFISSFIHSITAIPHHSSRQPIICLQGALRLIAAVDIVRVKEHRHSAAASARIAPAEPQSVTNPSCPASGFSQQ